MKFSSFKGAVRALVSRVGGGFNPRFSTSEGMHTARFPDGMIITGNTQTRKVTIRWGSGHQAMAVI